MIAGADWFPGMPGASRSHRAPVADRLALRTVVVSGCWEYRWCRDEDGYGVMRYGGRSFGRAHIAAWELAHGQDVPAGMVVRHTCDNPPCCRPDHLLLGSIQDNVDDRQARGRQCRGTAHHEGKLNEEAVRQIRAKRADGVPYTRVAAEYGISPAMVHSVVTGRAWAWVA